MYGARPVGTKIFCPYYRGLLNTWSPLKGSTVFKLVLSGTDIFKTVWYFLKILRYDKYCGTITVLRYNNYMLKDYVLLTQTTSFTRHCMKESCIGQH